jgi:hypothetical protein
VVLCTKSLLLSSVEIVCCIVLAVVYCMETSWQCVRVAKIQFVSCSTPCYLARVKSVAKMKRTNKNHSMISHTMVFLKTKHIGCMMFHHLNDAHDFFCCDPSSVHLDPHLENPYDCLCRSPIPFESGSARKTDYSMCISKQDTISPRRLILSIKSRHPM